MNHHPIECPLAGPVARPAGALARFEGPEQVVHAVRRARAAGYRRLDVFSPYPIHGIDEAMGMGRSVLPYWVLAGGLVGAAVAWFGQWYCSAVDFPIIVAAKPFHSREAWVPITFELTVLFAALTAVFGMLALNGLPRLYHPVFRASRFDRATRDGFFLWIEAADPKFGPEETPALLGSIGGADVELVDEED